MLGPRELEGDAVRDRPQPVEALEVDETLAQAHVVQLANRARRESVSARLLARKVLAFDDRDSPPTRREPVRRRRAGRSRTDDEHVVRFVAELTVAARAHKHMITCSGGPNRSVRSGRFGLCAYVTHDVPRTHLAW